MEKTVEVKVAGSTYDILCALTKAISGFKAAKKSGGNVMTELVAIEAALAPVMNEAMEITSETLESDLKALAVCGPDLIAAIKG